MEMENIVSAIKSKNEIRDTIIIFQSDNGGAPFIKGERHGCNYPYKGEKTLLTEGGTLVPSFIYSVKETIVDQVFDGIFHVTDWFPTIMSLAKISKKRITQIGHIDGIDQSAALTGRKTNKNARTQMVYGMIGIWIPNTVINILISHFVRSQRMNYPYSTKTSQPSTGHKNIEYVAR